MSLKTAIKPLIHKAVLKLIDHGDLAIESCPDIDIQYTKNPKHGDFSCNIAMIMAKQVGLAPLQLAEKITAQLPTNDLLKKIEIAPPGFINFFLHAKAYQNIIKTIHSQADQYGQADIGKKRTILLEYVSANPTGPLHVGHGRGGAYGASLANLLKKVGFEVEQEYYINDAGRQMEILTLSVWLRYLALYNHDIPFPDNAYQGDYIKEIATQLSDRYHDQLTIATIALNPIADAEKQLDQMIDYMQNMIDQKHYKIILQTALDYTLNNIKQELSEFGVHYDNWCSELTIADQKTLQQITQTLIDNQWAYEQSGAIWFRSSKAGDEKDRVLIRDNGKPTYFLTDIAYHLNKYQRKYHKMINIWGADHHGYIARIKAAMQALQQTPEKLEIRLVQFATLYQNKTKIKMSTRSGQFVTLKALQEEIGTDATRFFYVLRKSEQQLDFDIDLAKSKSNDNPVYYIQYAHARICSIFKKLADQGWHYDRNQALNDIQHLNEPQELTILDQLARYPDLIQQAALAYEPHQLAYYLRELAHSLHLYYNTNQCLVEQENIRNARLVMLESIQQVIKDGLSILGVNAPQQM